MTILVEKFIGKIYRNHQVHQSGVRFDEIMDNLLTKLGVQ